MSKAIIGVGAVLIILAIAALILIGGGDAPTKTPQTAPPTHAPAQTPDNVYNTIKPTETPEVIQTPQPTPVEKYVDASKGGKFITGDEISYLGVDGEISSGSIDNGKVSTSSLIMKDEEAQTILNYAQRDYPEYGHLELISYPQNQASDTASS